MPGIAEVENPETGTIEVVVEEEDLDEQPNMYQELDGEDIMDEDVEVSMPHIIKHKEVLYTLTHARTHAHNIGAKATAVLLFMGAELGGQRDNQRREEIRGRGNKGEEEWAHAGQVERHHGNHAQCSTAEVDGIHGRTERSEQAGGRFSSRQCIQVYVILPLLLL